MILRPIVYQNPVPLARNIIVECFKPGTLKNYFFSRGFLEPVVWILCMPKDPQIEISGPVYRG